MALEVQQPDAGRVDAIADGHLLIIRLNRPEKRNGFTPEMGLALAQAYSRLEKDPDLRVALLCAAGDHFTAGLDLPRWADAMREGRSMWPPDLIDPFDLREPRRSKPVVAAVQGICFTLGIELMLAADMVVAADNCRFSQLEVKRGIMATGGATVRMAERAGTGTALYHLLVA
ncbi:MAG: enoyl-CoA hydratase, partial [Betaproteobacteria bacterium]|nr:enoyl-CoA hydratase [Betaproteobacteria bacterium]